MCCLLQWGPGPAIKHKYNSNDLASCIEHLSDLQYKQFQLSSLKKYQD